MLVVNFISDNKGRRVALIIVQICGIIGFGGTNEQTQVQLWQIGSDLHWGRLQHHSPPLSWTVLLRTQWLYYDDPDLPLPLRVL